MRLSHYFLPLIKENPSEAAIASHRLMLRSGMMMTTTRWGITTTRSGMTTSKSLSAACKVVP